MSYLIGKQSSVNRLRIEPLSVYTTRDICRLLNEGYAYQTCVDTEGKELPPLTQVQGEIRRVIMLHMHTEKPRIIAEIKGCSGSNSGMQWSICNKEEASYKETLRELAEGVVAAEKGMSVNDLRRLRGRKPLPPNQPAGEKP